MFSRKIEQLHTLLAASHEFTKAVSAKLDKVLHRMENVMATLQSLRDAQARLGGDVAAMRTVSEGVVTLLGNQAQQLHDLADQIELLKQNPDQQTIDDLVSQTNALADQVETTTAQVTAAVTANTPVAGERVPPVPEPTGS